MSRTMQRTYAECLARLDRLRPDDALQSLGVRIDGDALRLRFFDAHYRIASGVILDANGDPPTDGVGIVLCQYLLHHPDGGTPDGSWVTFRELPGAGPLVSSFTANTNKLIAHTFAERLDDLQRRVGRLGACPETGAGAFDLFVRFDALPKVPLFLQFNAADDLFPAQCNLLFYQSAQHYLDMQSLFIVGTYLAGRLIRGIESP